MSRTFFVTLGTLVALVGMSLSASDASACHRRCHRRACCRPACAAPACGTACGTAAAPAADNSAARTGSRAAGTRSGEVIRHAASADTNGPQKIHGS